MLQQKITIRLSEEENRQIKMLAESSHMTISEFIRQSLFHQSPVEAIELRAKIASGLCRFSALISTPMENDMQKQEVIQEVINELWRSLK